MDNFITATPSVRLHAEFYRNVNTFSSKQNHNAIHSTRVIQTTWIVLKRFVAAVFCVPRTARRGYSNRWSYVNYELRI